MTQKHPNNLSALTMSDTFFTLYDGNDEKVGLRVLIKGDTIWLSQSLMAELFHTTSDSISLHLKNIYSEEELIADATTEDFSVVQNESGREVRRILKHYNLDAIIAVGYRVNSKKSNPVSYLGNPNPPRIHHKRIRLR